LVFYDDNSVILWSSGTSASCSGGACALRYTSTGTLDIYHTPTATTAYSFTTSPVAGGTLTVSGTQPYLFLTDASGVLQFATQYLFGEQFQLLNGQVITQGNLLFTVTNDANAAVYQGSVTGVCLIKLPHFNNHGIRIYVESVLSLIATSAIYFPSSYPPRPIQQWQPPFSFSAPLHASSSLFLSFPSVYPSI
jgi:hypothetical protein